MTEVLAEPSARQSLATQRWRRLSRPLFSLSLRALHPMHPISHRTPDIRTSLSQESPHAEPLKSRA